MVNAQRASINMKKKSILSHSLLLLPIAVLASGCIAIPVPSNPMTGASNPMRGSSFPGLPNNYDADEFAKKLVTLEVGRTTVDQAVSVLGKPSARVGAPGLEMLTYELRVKGGGFAQMGQPSAALTFKNGVLSTKEVTKVSMNDGTYELGSVYRKGQ